jgi:DNA-binding transcriptional LysR family regulator
VNLDQLEVIQAIIDKGSFRAAAEHLHRSQPALSASIKNLEEEFGIQIFDRSEYRPKLTDVGSVFVNSAKKTLEAAYQTTKLARELGENKTETKLRVSVDPLVSIEAIELIAHECARPSVPVILILNKSVLQGSHSLIIDGKVDLALAPCPPGEDRVEKIIIEKVTLVAAVSRKLLQEKRKADSNFLKTHAQIFVYNKDFDDPPDELVLNPIYDGGSPKIYVPDHHTKLQLIQNGLGWGRISQAEFDESEGLVMIDKKTCPPIELELCLMKPKFLPIGPIARVIWSIFEKKNRHKNR